MKLIAFVFFQKYRLAKYLPESPADGKTVCLSLFHSFNHQQLVCLRSVLISTCIILYWYLGSKDEKRSSESLSGTDSSS